MMDYKKAINTLSKIRSSSDFNKSNRNKLIDMQLSTEDEWIIQRINRLLSIFEEADRLKIKRLPLAYSQNMERGIKIVEELIVYCNNIVKSDKPEWMVLAERNGWRPPM